MNNPVSLYPSQKNNGKQHHCIWRNEVFWTSEHPQGKLASHRLLEVGHRSHGLVTADLHQRKEAWRPFPKIFLREGRTRNLMNCPKRESPQSQSVSIADTTTTTTTTLNILFFNYERKYLRSVRCGHHARQRVGLVQQLHLAVLVLLEQLVHDPRPVLHRSRASCHLLLLQQSCYLLTGPSTILIMHDSRFISHFIYIKHKRFPVANFIPDNLFKYITIAATFWKSSRNCDNFFEVVTI